jgi:hypothetical protein
MKAVRALVRLDRAKKKLQGLSRQPISRGQMELMSSKRTSKLP